MCGIAGIISSCLRIDSAGLSRMNTLLAVRGPDNEGIFKTEHVGLVHRRLSILDLSENGNCPIANEDGTILALLNGEIYNWRELRAELVENGHNFISMSDSEILTHGYEQWGEKIFARLRGMFSIAIWDSCNSQMLLARDRVGEKPLYFDHSKERTIFASTIGAVVAYEQKENQLNEEALICYLSHSFIPASHCIWKNVNVFPPAHYAIIGKDNRLSLQRYWEFSDRSPISTSVNSAALEVAKILDDSVSRCLDVDVPAGILLSGGVDSSLVAAFAQRHVPGIPSFSLGFKEQAFSELKYAQKVADIFGLDHHEILIDAEDVLRILPELIYQYGQPFGDASAVPTYLISKLARTHVKVCLSGDGGDESFGGYWRAQSGLFAAYYRLLLPEILKKRIIPKFAQRFGLYGQRLLALNNLALSLPGRGYTNSESWYGKLESVIGLKIKPGLNHDISACRVGRDARMINITLLQRILYDDFKVLLPDAYLTKVDIASMAASLEVRAPFLDYKVIEHAWTLPDKFKIRWGQRKWLLKKIAAKSLPKDIVYRPKIGFGMPLSDWFKGVLGEVLTKLMRTSRAEKFEIIKSNIVLRELEEHRNNISDNSTRLWLVLWLELWFRICFEEELKPNASLFTI